MCRDPTLAARLDKVVDRLVVRPFGSPLPSALFHYTDWAGFEGIVKSQRLWATGHDHFDDRSELAHLDSLALELASKFKTDAPPLGRAVFNEFAAQYEDDRISRRFLAFITCFSSSGVIKSQWMKYARCGTGVCLKIRVIRDEPVPDQGRRDIARATFRVEYSRDAWRRSLSRAFTNVARLSCLLDACKGRNRIKAKKLLRAALFRISALASSQAKSEDYREEDEWRHVALTRRDHPPIEVVTPDTGRRRLDLAVRAGSRLIFIEEVIIGSYQDFSSARRRAHDILAAQYPGPDAPMPTITRSTVL